MFSLMMQRQGDDVRVRLTHSYVDRGRWVTEEGLTASWPVAELAAGGTRGLLLATLDAVRALLELEDGPSSA